MSACLCRFRTSAYVSFIFCLRLSKPCTGFFFILTMIQYILPFKCFLFSFYCCHWCMWDSSVQDISTGTLSLSLPLTVLSLCFFFYNQFTSSTPLHAWQLYSKCHNETTDISVFPLTLSDVLYLCGLSQSCVLSC